MGSEDPTLSFRRGRLPSPALHLHLELIIAMFSPTIGVLFSKRSAFLSVSFHEVPLSSVLVFLPCGFLSSLTTRNKPLEPWPPDLEPTINFCSGANLSPRLVSADLCSRLVCTATKGRPGGAVRMFPHAELIDATPRSDPGHVLEWYTNLGMFGC